MQHANSDLWGYELNILIHYEQLQEPNLEQLYQDSYTDEIMMEEHHTIKNILKD
jgi:hypothetical protein